MTRLPKYLKIGAWTIDIDEKETEYGEHAGLHGRYYDTTHGKTIEVCATQAPLSVLDTLIHEILHVGFHFTGLTHDQGINEEMVVSAMGTFLSSVLAENPDLVKTIVALTKKKPASG